MATKRTAYYRLRAADRADALRRAMALRRISFRQLAAFLGVSHGSVSRWCYGTRPIPHRHWRIAATVVFASCPECGYGPTET